MDPRHTHEFVPNRKGLCKRIIKYAQCGLPEGAPVHTRLTEEVKELRKQVGTEVREWLCPKCNVVFPPPITVSTLCPRCGNVMGPRLTVENETLKNEIALLTEKLERYRETQLHISPWDDRGWVPGTLLESDKSPCCKAKVYASLADGIFTGTCAHCNSYVVRVNPRTGKQEVPSMNILEFPKECTPKLLSLCQRLIARILICPCMQNDCDQCKLDVKAVLRCGEEIHTALLTSYSGLQKLLGKSWKIEGCT